MPQSQATFITFQKKKTGNTGSYRWNVQILKQKVEVDGLTYELQEIYGMDGAITAAPKDEATGTSDGSGNGAATALGGKRHSPFEVPDGAECIICMSEPRNTTVLPCRHMCLCGECAEALRRNGSTCPICRTKVESLLQIRVERKETDEEEEEEAK